MDKDLDLKLRKNLIGNIRYWHFKKDLLWFGNKCYHIVDHSFNHAKNVWNIANQILFPLSETLENLDLGEDLYAFCMAIWLHDIGHKGNGRYGEPHQIRNLHPLISCELILQNPSHYGIFLEEEEKKIYSYYANYTFSKEKSGISLIRDRISLASQKISLLEKIALLCAYHQKNCPITAEDVKREERIPIDYYQNGDKDNKVLTLESIYDNEIFLSLAVLLRFIDGLDINKNRVGDINEKEGRKKTIENDLEFTFKELKREVERIITTTPIEKGKDDIFRILFYEKVREEIQRDRWIAEEIKKEQRYFLNNLSPSPYKQMENYWTLVDHCLYLSVQEGHFNLHSAIDNIKIENISGKKIRITYYSNRTAEELLNKEKFGVKEYWEKEEKSIAEHLLGKGKEKGYVMKKLSLNKDLLERWFSLEENDIYLHTADGKELNKDKIESFLKDISKWQI
jgi:hypothetical protein